MTYTINNPKILLFLPYYIQHLPPCSRLNILIAVSHNNVTNVTAYSSASVNINIIVAAVNLNITTVVCHLLDGIPCSVYHIAIVTSVLSAHHNNYVSEAFPRHHNKYCLLS